MNWKKFNYIYLALLFVLIVSGGLSYYWANNSMPQTKPRVPVVQEPAEEDLYQVSQETKVYLKEQYLLCKKYNLKCSEDNLIISDEEKSKLIGLNLEEVQKKYSLENMTIEQIGSQIMITSFKEGLCPEHKKIMHLGPNGKGNFITVYFGPGIVQNEGGIYKVTEIQITHLPLQYQEKIKNHTMEFYHEEELIAILDSFSESFH